MCPEPGSEARKSTGFRVRPFWVSPRSAIYCVTLDLSPQLSELQLPHFDKTAVPSGAVVRKR